MEYYSAIKKSEIMPFAANMDGPRNSHTEWSKSVRERQISYDNTYMWNLKKKGANELIYKSEIELQM